MLRSLFGDPPRQDDELLRTTIESIERLRRHLQSCIDNDEQPDSRFRRIEVRTRGFLASLDELEESKYCSERFGSRMSGSSYLEELTDGERLDYYRHVYFYKNGFVRIFSMLDKLGHLLNDYYQLKTEKVKTRFSYFTVLRRIRELRAHPNLLQELSAIKDRYEQPLERLRKQRNMEIHFLNVEDGNELIPSSVEDDRTRLDNISENCADLHQGYVMVCTTLRTAFIRMLRDCPAPSRTAGTKVPPNRRNQEE